MSLYPLHSLSILFKMSEYTKLLNYCFQKLRVPTSFKCFSSIDYLFRALINAVPTVNYPIITKFYINWKKCRRGAEVIRVTLSKLNAKNLEAIFCFVYIHSFIHSFIHSTLARPLFRLLLYLLIHWLDHSFIYSFKSRPQTLPSVCQIIS